MKRTNNSENVDEYGNDHPTLSTNSLNAVRDLDPQSWSDLVTTFGPIVYGWCRVSGVCESEAPDVVQNVFASVARNVARFERRKETGSFRSWLAAITRNSVRDHFRALVKRQEAAGGTSAWQFLQKQSHAMESTICPEVGQGLLHQQVLDSVRAEFEPQTWQAFWETTVDERKAKDVAESLGISVASVYKAKSRVLARFRTRLAEIPN